MTRTQLTNLISYYLLMKSDRNFESSMDYISEKYGLFFSDKQSINIIEHYNKNINSSLVFKHIINSCMDRWNIKITDDNFYKFYTTFIIVFTPDNQDNLSMLIKRYKNLVTDEDILSNKSMVHVIHPVLKEKLDSIIVENKLTYRNLFLKELSNKFKQNHI